MDERLLLVKIVTLLYRDQQLTNRLDTVPTLVNEALGHIKTPEQVNTGDFSHDSVTSLKEISHWLMKATVKIPYEEFQQRITVTCQNDKSLLDGILEPCKSDLTQENILEFCQYNINEIRIYLSTIQIKGLLKSAYLDTHYKGDLIDWSELCKTVTDQLVKIETNISGNGGSYDSNPHIVDSVDFDDDESLINIIQSARDELSSDGMIRFGWKGFNRMWGNEQEAAKRGEMLLISALQHNYKSGTALSLFRHHAQYNKPHMIDPTAKPCLLRMSFETSARYDVNFLYDAFYENETGLPSDFKSVSPKEAKDFVQQRLKQNGYSVKLMNINPTEFTVYELFDICNKLIAKGYEIHQLNMDYLNMISKKGCAGNGPTGTDIRELFRRVRNYTAERKILTITPHQMSSDAKKMIRENTPEADFVNKVANKGYYDGCSGLDQEVDIEIYQHIVKVNGESYMTFRRGKHRKVGPITPEKDLYCVYKMEKIGGIPDDINGKDMSRRRVGGNTEAEGGGAAWYDF